MQECPHSIRYRVPSIRLKRPEVSPHRVSWKNEWTRNVYYWFERICITGCYSFLYAEISKSWKITTPI
jgi:hypothetical protein